MQVKTAVKTLCLRSTTQSDLFLLIILQPLSFSLHPSSLILLSFSLYPFLPPPSSLLPIPPPPCSLWQNELDTKPGNFFPNSMATKFVFVTGGVVSSIGKGIVAASF